MCDKDQYIGAFSSTGPYENISGVWDYWYCPIRKSFGEKWQGCDSLEIVYWIKEEDCKTKESVGCPYHYAYLNWIESVEKRFKKSLLITLERK